MLSYNGKTPLQLAVEATRCEAEGGLATSGLAQYSASFLATSWRKASME